SQNGLKRCLSIKRSIENDRISYVVTLLRLNPSHIGYSFGYEFGFCDVEALEKAPPLMEVAVAAAAARSMSATVTLAPASGESPGNGFSNTCRGTCNNGCLSNQFKHDVHPTSS